MKSENLVSLDRFWLIFLPSLEKPRSMKEISHMFGLIKESGQPMAHLYQSNIAKQMQNAGALKRVSSQFDKEIKYLSIISFLGYNKKINNFLEQDWVRKELLSTEKLLELYGNDLRLIKKRGNEFISLVLNILSSFYASVKLSDNMKNKYPPSISKGQKKKLDTQRKALLPFLFHLSYPSLEVKGYLLQIFDSLLIHEQEIVEFVENLSK
jgi:hypothetical protein